MSNSGTDRIEPSLAPEGAEQPTADPAQSADSAGAGGAETGQSVGEGGDTANVGEFPFDPRAAQADSEPGVAGNGAGLQQQIETLKEQLAQENDRYLRSMAEMENIRRRATSDVAKAHKFAIESFAEAMVPVKDSLEMALKVETPTVESLREGTEATLRQLVGAFERNQLVEIDPLGEKFDPNRHQAISMVPAASTNPPVEPNHVATVLQKGYLINDRVLRPALVMVAQA